MAVSREKIKQLEISSIICTHNRATDLCRALRSLLDQSLPVDQYEIIVVDNASTDETAEVCAEFSRVRRIAEPRLGLNIARETGWRNAVGRYVAYLDDDATACSEWLARILEAFETVKPTPGTVGGRIELVFEHDPPTWLDESRRLSLAQVDWSSEPHWVMENEWLAGCNIAFDRKALMLAGGFAEALDRRGANLLSSGEILMTRKIERLGRNSYYQPAAGVLHFVPATRLDHRWFLRRAYWQGVSESIMDIELNRTARAVGAVRSWRRLRKSGQGLNSFVRLCRTYPDVMVLNENIRTLYGLGLIRGYFFSARATQLGA